MRRTSYLLFVLLLLAGLSLLSCSRDPEEEEKKEQEDKKVEDWENNDINGDATMAPRVMQFSLLNSDTLPDPEVETRGGVGTATTDHYAFDVNDLVTISITGKGKKVYKITNVETDPLTQISTGELEYNGTPSTDGFYWETKDDINVTAWSKGSTSTIADDPNGETFDLEKEQQTNGYQELLYMEETTKSFGTEGKISLSLEHMLSRIVITVNQDAATAQTISGITIGSNNVPTRGVFDTSEDKKWKNQGSNGTITPKTEATNSIYSAVLIPYKFTSTTANFINITIGSETFAYELPANTEFLAGKQYNYTITVKNRAITFSVTVSNWTDASKTLNF